MRQRQLIYLFLGLFIALGVAFPKTAMASLETRPIAAGNILTLKLTTFTSDAVSINYEIPFAGMILFYLFDEEENLIWQTQYTRKRGENSILLKAGKLDQGRLYNFKLEYKGNSYSGQFKGR